MLNVFLTVDTELWPLDPGWPQHRISPVRTDFSRERALYIDGATAQGEYGVPYQIATLERYGLKACFFVEALCAGRIGRAPLEQIVGQVQRGGHEVQLHLHTEWLRELREPALPSRWRPFMHQYTRREQAALIRHGLAALHAAGAAPLRAFRAGSFGANRDTLRALAECGVAFDSSCNPTCLHPDWDRPDMLEQPAWIDGVVELPVSSFRDYPGHRRHAQLCACSFAEMSSALLAAWQAGWYSFVIVLHSFELVRRRRRSGGACADRVNIARFEQLCAFLAAHRDKFASGLFRDLDPAAVPLVPCAPALRSPLAHTLRRVAQQGWSRCAWPA
jgi:hypothetical protein